MADSADPAADFAALMSKAAESADATPPEAPYGYMKDPETGEMRPKKTAGRPRKPPSLDEMKAEKEAGAADTGEGAADQAGRPADRAPQPPKGRRAKRAKGDPKPDKPVPQHREGQIAKGMNKLYRRAGKLVRVMDAEIGTALIEATKKEDDEDVTVGEAWEEVARTNPRIRRFLLAIIQGGAYGALFWAHAPILLAILMKDAISKHIPFSKLMTAFLSEDEDGESPADGTPMQGLKSSDMNQMMAMAQQFAEQMASGRGIQMPRQPEATPEAA